MTVPISTPSLPVISLSEHRTLESLATALYSACTGEGFLYVSDHGIPQATIDEVFGFAQGYFLHARSEDKVDLKENTGYTAVRQESLDSTKPSSGDLKECFHFADTHWLRNHGQKQDLPDSLEPSRKKIETFIGHINGVAERLLQGLAVALKLPPDFLSSQHKGQHNRLRLLHYPPAEINHKDLDPGNPDIRAGAHTDYGSITVLFQHCISGLQVSRAGAWIDVPPREGCLVINVGDALEFWSGGLFKSTLHRVVMPRHQAETASRYSIAYFVQPDSTSVLEPLVNEANEAVLDEIIARKGLPAGTRRINGGDYVQARLQATYPKKG